MNNGKRRREAKRADKAPKRAYWEEYEKNRTRVICAALSERLKRGSLHQYTRLDFEDETMLGGLDVYEPYAQAAVAFLEWHKQGCTPAYTDFRLFLREQAEFWRAPIEQAWQEEDLLLSLTC